MGTVAVDPLRSSFIRVGSGDEPVTTVLNFSYPSLFTSENKRTKNLPSCTVNHGVNDRDDPVPIILFQIARARYIYV